jgi:polysaccharide biosynthesis protein PslH
MKLLFISARDVTKKKHGGELCTNRNFLSFCELLGNENIEVLDLIPKRKRSVFRSIFRRINQLFGFFEGLSYKKIKQIVEASKEYDYVFIDTSKYGIIAYYLKKAGYAGKIISHFHNIEYNIERQKIKIAPFRFLNIFLAYYNEKKACRYSDTILALNSRDSRELQRIYRAYNISIMPVSLHDTYNNQNPTTTSVPPVFLFIGAHWFPNIMGLRWFVNNILDHVNIKLQIVGSGMDVLKNEFVHPKIEFLGFVPDLSLILINADYVLCPIFIGGGMKVKICESLMYGKNIIATREAFEGYEIDYHLVGAMCNSREEFINTITDLASVERKKFNEYSRKCFLEKYSFEATLTRFDELLSDLSLNK